ncbi:hypothetical protein [Methylobacterium sp. WSM2598]|uniref:hypothetical protein n=1 Tax=Methylobacterium sp. WSM2598 TaxID=398261 RepID=UPI000376B897|nr:hypothetical protein [Methylobacterium sp. WSM2598]
MTLDDPVRDAIPAELRRRAEAGDLRVSDEGEAAVRVKGRIALDEFVMAVIGALAGGP